MVLEKWIEHCYPFHPKHFTTDTLQICRHKAQFYTTKIDTQHMKFTIHSMITSSWKRTSGQKLILRLYSHVRIFVGHHWTTCTLSRCTWYVTLPLCLALRLEPREPTIIYTSMGECIEICISAPTTKTDSSNWNWDANTEVVCGYRKKQLMMLEYAIGNDTSVLSIWEASVCECTTHLGGQCDMYAKRWMLGGPPKHQKWIVR